MEYLGLEQIKWDKFCPKNKGTVIREKEKTKSPLLFWIKTEFFNLAFIKNKEKKQTKKPT